MADTLTLTIFRHGLTLENEKRQYLGWTDAPLSEEGLKETQAIAQLLAGWQPDLLVSSDLVRCQETTKLLFANQPFSTSTAFREMNFGEFEGKTYQQLKNQPKYQLWLADMFRTHVPGGESFGDFSRRVDEGMRDLANNGLEKRDLVLVTHGGVMRLLLSQYVQTNRTFFDWDIPNSYGYQLVWENKESFRRLDKCTSLSVVPSTAKEDG